MTTRRKLISTLGISLVITEQWEKPYVSGIVLPLQAQTSHCNVIDLAGRWQFTEATSKLHQQASIRVLSCIYWRIKDRLKNLEKNYVYQEKKVVAVLGDISSTDTYKVA